MQGGGGGGGGGESPPARNGCHAATQERERETTLWRELVWIARSCLGCRSGWGRKGLSLSGMAFCRPVLAMSPIGTDIRCSLAVSAEALFEPVSSARKKGLSIFRVQESYTRNFSHCISHGTSQGKCCFSPLSLFLLRKQCDSRFFILPSRNKDLCGMYKKEGIKNPDQKEFSISNGERP